MILVEHAEHGNKITLEHLHGQWLLRCYGVYGQLPLSKLVSTYEATYWLVKYQEVASYARATEEEIDEINRSLDGLGVF